MQGSINNILGYWGNTKCTPQSIQNSISFLLIILVIYEIKKGVKAMCCNKS